MPQSTYFKLRKMEYNSNYFNHPLKIFIFINGFTGKHKKYYFICPHNYCFDISCKKKNKKKVLQSCDFLAKNNISGTAVTKTRHYFLVNFFFKWKY